MEAHDVLVTFLILIPHQEEVGYFRRGQSFFDQHVHDGAATRGVLSSILGNSGEKFACVRVDPCIP